MSNQIRNRWRERRNSEKESEKWAEILQRSSRRQVIVNGT
jgi:hypothetical protein